MALCFVFGMMYVRTYEIYENTNLFFILLYYMSRNPEVSLLLNKELEQPHKRVIADRVVAQLTKEGFVLIPSEGNYDDLGRLAMDQLNATPKDIMQKYDKDQDGFVRLIVSSIIRDGNFVKRSSEPTSAATFVEEDVAA